MRVLQNFLIKSVTIFNEKDLTVKGKEKFINGELISLSDFIIKDRKHLLEGGLVLFEQKDIKEYSILRSNLKKGETVYDSQRQYMNEVNHALSASFNEDKIVNENSAVSLRKIITVSVDDEVAVEECNVPEESEIDIVVEEEEKTANKLKSKSKRSNNGRVKSRVQRHGKVSALKC